MIVTEEVEEEVFAEDYDNDEPVKGEEEDVKNGVSEKEEEPEVEEEEDDDEPLVNITIYILLYLRI